MNEYFSSFISIFDRLFGCCWPVAGRSLAHKFIHVCVVVFACCPVPPPPVQPFWPTLSVSYKFKQTFNNSTAAAPADAHKPSYKHTGTHSLIRTRGRTDKHTHNTYARHSGTIGCCCGCCCGAGSGRRVPACCWCDRIQARIQPLRRLHLLRLILINEPSDPVLG